MLVYLFLRAIGYKVYKSGRSLVDDGPVSAENQVCAVLPARLVVGYLPHVQVEIVGAREDELVVRSTEAATLHRATVGCHKKSFF